MSRSVLGLAGLALAACAAAGNPTRPTRVETPTAAEPEVVVSDTPAESARSAEPRAHPWIPRGLRVPLRSRGRRTGVA